MLSFLMLSAAVHGVTKNNHTRLWVLSINNISVYSSSKGNPKLIFPRMWASEDYYWNFN